MGYLFVTDFNWIAHVTLLMVDECNLMCFETISKPGDDGMIPIDALFPSAQSRSVDTTSLGKVPFPMSHGVMEHHFVQAMLLLKVNMANPTIFPLVMTKTC